MDNLVSIIVPVFNVEKYIEKCLISLCEQTYKNIEIIIIDDGSIDQSISVCEEYQKKDNRIKIIHQENKGLSAARNKGIENAKGEYISFIDSDDFVSKHFIEYMLKGLTDENCDITCCEAINFFDESEEKVEKCINGYSHYTAAVYNAQNLIPDIYYQKRYLMGAQLKVYKKKVVKDIKFPEGKLFEDVATTHVFFQNANNICFLKEKLYAYRNRNASILRSFSSKHVSDCKWLYTEISMKYSDAHYYKALICASYRMCRIVYSYAKYKDVENCLELWEIIKKVRKTIIADKNVSFIERFLIWNSYLGKNVYWGLLQAFNIGRMIKYKIKS
jgi:glycosyltransferase involved in cell wall biosynthesis|nr:glycosyltransferase family 2 protein [Butyrivibrio sp.]